MCAAEHAFRARWSLARTVGGAHVRDGDGATPSQSEPMATRRRRPESLMWPAILPMVCGRAARAHFITCTLDSRRDRPHAQPVCACSARVCNSRVQDAMRSRIAHARVLQGVAPRAHAADYRLPRAAYSQLRYMQDRTGTTRSAAAASTSRCLASIAVRGHGVAPCSSRGSGVCSGPSVQTTRAG